MKQAHNKITALLRQRRRGSSRGMTLVEVMISCLIAVFIFAAFLLLLNSSRSSWLVSQVQSDLYVSGRKAMHMMFRELVESASGSCSALTFLDPVSGQYRQMLCFPSGRGDPAVAGEDGSATNDYVHLGMDSKVSWRSAVVFCPFVTPDNNVQLRRYISYAAYDKNDFPLTISSVTPLNIILAKNGGVGTITFSRAAGTVLANYLGSEDSNNNNVLDANENNGNATLPLDNADGRLNLGANFAKGNGVVEITLFLSREVAALSQAGRFLASTVRSSAKFRQP